MNKEVECTTCGNTDFIQESGFYYCSQCQTQTQEIQEHVLEDNFNQDEQNDIIASQATKSKKKETKKQRQEQNNLTSWECWNIVLKSLVDQLIELGADESIKPVVKNLWLAYLEKMEVLNFKRDELPRLQLVNSVRDTSILYGTKKRRRRKISGNQSSSDESQSTSTGTLKRQMAKKKRALAEVHYETSQKSLPESSNLADETLSSIKSPSVVDGKESRKLQLNKLATAELKRVVRSKKHIKNHKEDIYRELHCHMTYRQTSRKYNAGAAVLTQSRIYSLLYLGLLITGDKIVLGDLLRFIREGNLDYNAYQHLFPEEYTIKNISISTTFLKPIKHLKFRKSTAELAQLLDVCHYVQGPDLVELTNRFCVELNLPKQIHEAVSKLIAKSKPTLQLSYNSSKMPNYEGRAMSLIIFTLKLFFSFDGVTEHKFSYFAQLLNTKKIVRKEGRMFDVISWLKHLEYRRFVIGEHHFPTQYQENPTEVDSDLYIKHVKEKQVHFDSTKRQIHSDYPKMLEGILNLQEDSDQVDLQFPPTLTPFHDYAEILLKSDVIKGKRYMLDLLETDFSKDSMMFLTKSAYYLPLVARNGTIPVKNGGANDKWILKQIENKRIAMQRYHRRSKELIQIQYGTYDANLDTVVNDSLLEDISKRSDCIDVFFSNFQQSHNSNFTKNRQRESKNEECELDETTDDTSDAFYSEHFYPFERYWMNFKMYLDWENEENADKYFNEFTQTYKIVFEDCARIIEHSVKQLLYEYQISEVYLVYLSTNLRIDQTHVEGDLENLLTHAAKHW